MKPKYITIACLCGIWKVPRVEQCKEELTDCPRCKGLGHYQISTVEELMEEINAQDNP
jgi:hypothetical protein